MKKTYRKSNGVTRIVRANYSGGVRSEGWKAKTKAIIKRDGDVCCKCGKSRKLLNALGIQLQMNHVRMVSRGGTDSCSNLQLECERCHAKNFKHGHLLRRKKLKKNREKAKTERIHRILRKTK